MVSGNRLYSAMFIIGIGTATPGNCYRQQQCWDTLKESARFREFTPRSRAILKKVLTGDNGIATRYLALDDLEQAFVITPDVLQARFLQHAPALAAQAAERALAQAGLQPRDMDAVLISTCTGYLCPGLTSYVSERLGLRPEILALDLVGQGCGAAMPNLQTAHALIHSANYRHVLSICVEVCSAAFYLDDDAGVLISACLFGDGAAAAVLSGEANGNRRVQWKAAGTLLKPADREHLRMEHKNGMLRNILKPEVPSLAARTLRNGLGRDAGAQRCATFTDQELDFPHGRTRRAAGVARKIWIVAATTCAGAKRFCASMAT